LFDEFPDELKQGDVFVMWKSSNGSGSENPSKPPLTPDGSGADVTTSNTWTDYETCVAAFLSRPPGAFDGIGRVLTEGDPYVGVDLDHCRDPQTGQIAIEAQNIVDHLDSYTEISPSGTGLHIWLIGTLENLQGHRAAYGGGNFEAYEQARYFTVTANHLAGTRLSVESRQSELEDVHHTVFGFQPSRTTPSQHNTVPTNVVVDLAASLPQSVEILIKRYSDLQLIWDKKYPPRNLKDKSLSGWCKVFEDQLVSNGVTPQDLSDALVAYRRKHFGMNKSPKWYEAEVRSAYLRADQMNRSKPPLALRDISPGDEVQLITFDTVYRHSLLLNNLNESMLLIALSRYARDGRYVWPSHATLAEELGLSDKWISDLMKRLISNGCIKIVERSAPGRSQKYELFIHDDAHHRLNDCSTVRKSTVERSWNRSQYNGGRIKGVRDSQWGGAAA